MIKKLQYFYATISVFIYFLIAFFLERTQFSALVFCFAILFFCYYKLLKINSENLKILIFSTFAFRLIFLVSLPNLSQDFYRFIWDGRLILSGLNPYLQLPKDLILNANFLMPKAKELVFSMGELSAKHYSNYPPINQLCYAIAGFFSPNSIIGAVVVLRLIIVTADLGILYFGQKLLKNIGLNPNKIYWYLLNPLVVLELSGNLHFEGVMLFFLVLSIYLLQKNNYKWASFFIAISISVKLLPLLLLPILYKYLGLKKAVIFYGFTLFFCFLFFVPFLSSELIDNYSKTIGLWFTNFEFNASIYYIIRYIGQQIYGYNIIQTVGKIIPVMVILFILFKAFFSKNKTEIDLFNTFLIVLSIYFFTATTIHPWYIINLVFLSVFTQFKYPIYWSFVIILSYFAYSNPEFKENFYLIFIEYAVVFTMFFLEISNKKLNFIGRKEV